MNFPPSFSERMIGSLAGEYDAFVAAHEAPPPISLRLHPQKGQSFFAENERVAWHPDGRYLPERPVFTLDPHFQAGAYYVQEASSMFLFEALQQICDLSRPLRVLDLCAAPGGKSTLLLSAISPDSLLVANEVISSRVPALRQNLEKWGHPNAVVSHHDPADFARLTHFFDLMLVDAPCSGEGLFRRDANACSEWSEQSVGQCAARQRRILSDALPLLKPGGLLIYSTCTYNNKENEEQVRWLLKDGQELLPLHLAPTWGIASEGLGCQFYPHRVKGEGFFIACLRKPDAPRNEERRKPGRPKDWLPLPKNLLPLMAEWLESPEAFHFFQKPNGELVALPDAQVEDLMVLENALKKRSLGTVIGELKNRDFVPSHALAMNLIRGRDLPTADLDSEQALQFLRKETLDLAGTPKGWRLASFEGSSLGWVKVLDNRVNNYLPNEWRVLMRG